MICSTMASGAWVVSKKTVNSLPAALRKRPIGVVTITAPRVPPRTMMAAVNCATSLTLPSSSTSPPRIPASARARPPTVARSGRRPGLLPLESGAGAVVSVCAMFDSISAGKRGRVRRDAPPFREGRAEERAAIDGPPELHHPPDYLFGSFQHHQLLPRGQTDHRIGGHLDPFDEIRVEHQRQMIEAREVNHAPSILIGRARRSRPAFEQKAALPAAGDDPAAEPQFAVEQTVQRPAYGIVEGQHVAFSQAQQIPQIGRA